MTTTVILLITLVLFSYVGYPLWLAVLAVIRPRSVRRSTAAFSVSVIICARNEADRIAEKLENLRHQTYQDGPIEIIVVSDGSTDGTEDRVESVARAWRAEGCRLSLECLVLPRNVGKAAALNQGLCAAVGDVVVFADVRQRFEKNAIRYLLENLSDPAVGAVSGRLRFSNQDGSGQDEVSLGLYWRLETFVRAKQAQTGSVMGATGAIFAMRRALWRPLPADMLVDDLYTPLQIIDAGKRVVLDQRAVALDHAPASAEEEFRRKVRTLTGVWQCLPFLGKWLRAGKTGIAARLFAHKFSRLLVPWALLLLFILPLFGGSLYWTLFSVVQLVGYLLAWVMPRVPSLWRLSLCRAAHFFLLLNVAAAVSLFHAVKGGNRQLWTDSSAGRSL